MNNQTSPVIRLQTPLEDDTVLSLKVGAQVLLSGLIYTARDAAHQRLVQAIAAGHALPISLEGQVIYYVGPAPARPGEVTGPAGPTTASRVDPYTPPLLERGLKGVIGKGKRSMAVRQALVAYRAVYFVAVGGAAALIADCIKKLDLVAYPELGTEAIYRLEVVEFPLLVANDAYGADLYELGQAAYRREQAIR
ncbi:MAG: FumA C-terminus/TtdB family hydratase beta subunit [Anaerolineae bacterium]